MNEPDLTAAEVAVQGTPWQLGVRCDGPGCDANFEGDFLVAEDSTRSERLQVVLDYAERHGVASAGRGLCDVLPGLCSRWSRAMTADTGKPANMTMRTCGWCETVHPEHLSISWFPDRMYFCTDGCYQEWVEQSGCA